MTTFFEDIETGRRSSPPAGRSPRRTSSGSAACPVTSTRFTRTSSSIREHTPFRDRIAHGHLVLSITGGLRSELDGWRIVADPDCRRRFLAPVYAGDTIHATYLVTELRLSRSRPGTGVVTCEVETLNQEADVVQQGIDVLLVGTRDGSSPNGET